ncbi:Sensory box histidine kinase/response regulator [Labilithrix luteola]|uniref:histidine kinase n=1 Tax=Labilithrix luteola TaxID=1391654 RepID=A0A0K1Q2F7_9BACT|nr:ATP-binding protein [Labilithrix luteola]AKU99569.1 Sensory box histidine kinase/response regulator [Labilithrix luteola]
MNERRRARGEALSTIARLLEREGETEALAELEDVVRESERRIRTEHALQSTEASFRALIESMPDGVIVHRGSQLLYLSPSGRRMFGYGPDDDVTETHVLELVHPDMRERVGARITQTLEEGGPTPLLEERLIRRDGTAFVAEILALTTNFDGEPAVLAIARDITVRKQVEAQLVTNDRLASLGRLAGSVGHELNNPLAYVLGNVTLMERELARGATMSASVVARFSSYVEMVKEGALRMRDIVHDLKTLARGDAGGFVSVDVQHILDVCANMAEHELRSRARIVKEYRDRVFVWGIESRLGQVFSNLLLNAAQAIPAGNVDDNEVRLVVAAHHRDRVLVEILDTGIGVPPEDFDRIFEPFFTTKEGLGTGLGLSICHGIVTSMGGTISAEPGPERGTLFRLVLPSSAPSNG